MLVAVQRHDSTLMVTRETGMEGKDMYVLVTYVVVMVQVLESSTE